jgi:hypothetical protein
MMRSFEVPVSSSAKAGFLTPRGRKGEMRPTDMIGRDTGMREAHENLISNPPRNDDRYETGDRQGRAAIDPRHLVDHEARARIGKIAAALSNPNQADQGGENAGYQQCSPHGFHRVFFNWSMR